MVGSEILMYGLQLVTTIVLGLVSWSIKSAISDIKDALKKNSDEIEKVKKELSELKSDLPFVYVLREDFIRSLNNVDKSMSDMNGKLDRILQQKNKEG